MAGLDGLIIGRQRQIGSNERPAFLGDILEMLEQPVCVGMLEVVGAELLLLLQEHITVTYPTIIVAQVVDAFDALHVHGQPLKPVGQFTRHRSAIMPSNLLEIGELRDLHAVAPDFPSKAPGTQGRALPIILYKTNIVQTPVDADGIQRAKISIDEVVRRWLKDHLELIVMLQPIGVLTVAAIRRTTAGLDESRIPAVRSERSKRSGRVEGTGSHLEVIRLQYDAAALTPVALERKNDVLEG